MEEEYSLYASFFDAAMEGRPFYTEGELFEDLLRALDVLLNLAFSVKGEETAPLSMRGVVITAAECPAALTNRMYWKENVLNADVRGDLERIRRYFEGRLQAGEEEKTPVKTLRFPACVRRLRLTEPEALCLLMGLSVHMDRKYERLYSCLQDNPEETAPTLGLGVSLYTLAEGADWETAVKAVGGWAFRALFIIGGQASESFLAARLLLPDSAVRLFLEERERPLREMQRPVLLFREETAREMLRLWRREENTVVCLCGEKGIGKKHLVSWAAAEAGWEVLLWKVRAKDFEEEKTLRSKLALLLVESAVQDAVLCMELAEKLPAGYETLLGELISCAGNYGKRTAVLAQEREDGLSLADCPYYEINLPSLSFAEKKKLWAAQASLYEGAAGLCTEGFAGQYALSASDICMVLRTAALRAEAKGREQIFPEDITAAVGSRAGNRLGSVAVRLASAYRWEDLIMEERQKRLLKHACGRARLKGIVEEAWGFYEKASYGKGLSMLFYGEPGTGKTMAAQVVANELGMELYRVDLSQTVSKYIGETQKNISMIFGRARDMNAVLFFDEADALFARRSEVRDSNDRNANAETAHLLQQMEGYEGITILATNYAGNIDEAFKRRIKYMIRFRMPSVEERVRLWQNAVPERARTDEVLELGAFARAMELSGSAIFEVAAQAAYLAAAQERGIRNCDLLEALRIYCEKQNLLMPELEI